MTLEDYFGRWIQVLDMNELDKVTRILGSEYKNKLICPNQEDVFKAFISCSYQNLKVVMLLQDPYPQKDIATGITLANRKEIDEKDLSPSLKIVKEACINFEIPHNSIIFDQTLEEWSKQGVLLLNSALTVEMNKVGSHSMLWRSFITKLLKNLSERNPGIIYVLFGEQARTFTPYIGKNEIVLIEKHPAYYARVEQRMPSTIFDDIRRLTKEKYGIPIEWYKEC